MLSDKLQSARSGLRPGEAVPDSLLVAMGRTLSAEEAREGLALLDELARRREAVVEAGGPETEAEEVFLAQKQLSGVLGRVRPELLPVVAEGLDSTTTGVRFFTAGALLLAVDPSTLDAMRAARDIEPDRPTRTVLDRAIRIAGPPRIPWRRRRRKDPN